MARRDFEDYQLEELQNARAYLMHEWGQERFCSAELAPLAIMCLPEKRRGFFLGLTHNTDSVCAVVRLDDSPYLQLVHYSQLVLV